MSFTRNLPANQALKVGRLYNISTGNIWNANLIKKNFTLDEIKTIYDALKSGDLKIDGKNIKDYSDEKQIVYNNYIVNGIQALRRKQAKSGLNNLSGKIGVVMFGDEKFIGKIGDEVDKKGRVYLTCGNQEATVSINSIRIATESEIGEYESEEAAEQARSDAKDALWKTQHDAWMRAQGHLV